MKNGFTLLLSILIMSMALAMSLGIFNIVIAEIILSGTSRASQAAFYAADAGTECALYWDLWYQGGAESAFATTTPASSGVPNDVFCVDEVDEVNPVFITKTDAGLFGSGSSQFSLNLGNDSCVNVSVGKQYVDPGTGEELRTTVIAYGRSPCTGSRRVERGLRVTY